MLAATNPPKNPPYPQINMDPHLQSHPFLFPGVLGTLVRTNCHFSRPFHQLEDPQKGLSAK